MQGIAKKTIGVLIFMGIVWVGFTFLMGNSSERPSGNPNRAPTPAQRVKAEANRELIAYEAKRLRVWIDRIEKGEATFAEAACVYERRGRWGEAEYTCDDNFNCRL